MTATSAQALVEGLAEGKADLLGGRVKDLTGGTQHPVMTPPPTVPDYPIALVRR